MRPEVRDIVAQWHDRYVEAGSRVIELGSLDVNGNLRSIFADCAYVGIDMQAGPNVDIVANAHNLSKWLPGRLDDKWLPGRQVDVVVCCDMLEHDDRFWLSLAEIRRVLLRGGLFICSVPSIAFANFHQHPDDYWRFTESAFDKLIMSKAFYEVLERTSFWSPGIDAPTTYAAIARFR